jgi:hypothetical protein
VPRGLLFAFLLTWNERAYLRRAVEALVATEGATEMASDVLAMLRNPVLTREIGELAQSIESAHDGE